MIPRPAGYNPADQSYKSFPIQFWDLFGEGGLPVRTTISEMGPLLLSRILGLNDTQTGVMNIIFRAADDKVLLLLDLKDLLFLYSGKNELYEMSHNSGFLKLSSIIDLI